MGDFSLCSSFSLWSHLIFMTTLWSRQSGYFILREPDTCLFETSKQNTRKFHADPWIAYLCMWTDSYVGLFEPNANKGPSSQSYGFSSSHVWMWELDHKEGWAPKNWCFWTVVLEKTLESPSDCREIKPVNPKGYQSWIFIGRTDTETPILWPPDAKNWLLRKDPDAGKDWSQEDKGMTEWDGWMASPTWWTWVWASSRRWWWTGKPGMLQSMGSQRVRHDWATELNVVDYIKIEVYTVIIACLDYLIRRAFGLF